MITEYFRPDELEEALKLLARRDAQTIPLGGGLYINEVIAEPVAVVDVQDLGLREINKKGRTLHLGAGASLQSLVESDLITPVLKKAIKHQENYNRRQVATLAGAITAAAGRSPAAGMLLALDAQLTLASEGEDELQISMGDFLPLREEILAGKLIMTVEIPADVQAAYEYAARSPADLPIVGAGVVQWPSGRTRVVLMGFGDQPVMVFDGTESAGAEAAARDAYQDAGDQWAGAAYRSDAAGVLVNRCLNVIADNQEG